MQRCIKVAPGEDSGLQAIAVETLEVARGETSERLMYEGEEIVYYVTYGYGTLWIEGYGYPLDPETSIFIPNGTPHHITNSGEAVLQLVLYRVRLDSTLA